MLAAGGYKKRSEGKLKANTAGVRGQGEKRTYGVDGDDLSVGLLDLVELSEEVPESGLGDDLVRGEDPHSEELQQRETARRKGQKKGAGQ
jgi:hypothetical protein